MKSVHHTGAETPDDEAADVLRDVRRLLPQRPTIDDAKSALAAYLGCSETTALTELVHLAEDTGTSLAEVTAALAGAPAGAAPPEPEPAALDPLAYLTPLEYARPAGPRTDGDGAPTGQVGGVSDEGPSPVDAQAILDVIQADAAFLSPLPDASGEVTDFLIAAANAQARARYTGTGLRLVGARFRELWPEAAEKGLLDAYRAVLSTGEPLERGPFAYDRREGEASERVMLSVWASRVAGGVLVSWNEHDDQDQLMDRLRQVQRMTDLGWAEWDLIADQITWSPGMYRVFGRAPSQGPLTFEGLASVALPADLPIIRDAARKVYEKGEPVLNEFRIRRGGDIAYIRMLAEPVLDPHGRPVRLSVATTDVTKQRRDERALESARAQINRQRQAAEAQRRVTRELRNALLPIRDGTSQAAGLRYSVRYLSAESNARIGGDWFTVREMPDGDVLVAIGDAAGHGLEATALMARVRSGLGGLSYTGARSGRLTAWLNELVLFDQQQETATAIIGHFDPRSRELRWSCAGHPRPVLVRDGAATLLDGTTGTLLGAVRERDYPETVTRLRPGDLLLFYTDGLVERRGADIDDGIAALVGAAAACRGDDPDEDITTVLAELGVYTPEDDICLLALRVE